LGQSVTERPAVFERERAVAAIRSVLEQAAGGHGATLFLVGDAGLGKTTLLAEARDVARSSFTVGSGYGDAVEATLPFGIVSQALDDLGSRGLLGDSQGGVSGPDARAAHFYSVLRLLEVRSSKPIALLFDDLHWADADSLALLSFLCRRIAALPIAIIGALRPWPMRTYERVQQLSATGDAELERLEPLSETASVALLENRVGEPLAAVHLRLVRALTAGNPLLVGLLATSIAAGDTANYPAGPETDLILARFTGGTPDERRFAEAAAIFGTSFQASRAIKLAGIPARDADAALEGLYASGVLRSAKASLAEFAHPLLRQTLYEHIPPPVRGRKHAEAFRILLESGAEPGELVEHAVRGDLAGDSVAIDVLERSARQALRAGALATARQRFEAAAVLAGSKTPPKLLLSLAEVQLAAADAEAAQAVCRRLLDMDELAAADRIAAQRLLGRALFVAGNPHAALDQFEHAAEGASRSSPQDAVETLLEAVYVSWPTGGPSLAMPLASRARQLASEGPEGLRSRAETAWAFCAFVGGDAQGVPLIKAAARAAEADPASDIGDFAWTWGALGLHGNVAKWTERFDEAEAAFRVGIEVAERLQLPIAIASLAVMHGDTCARTGRFEEGLRWLDRASGLADLAPERAFWAAVAHSYILIEMGRAAEARTWAETAHSLADPAASWPGWLWLWHVDAQLAMQDRRVEEACGLYERIEQLADQSGVLEPCVVPWMGDALSTYAAAHRFDDANRMVQRLEQSVQGLPCRIPRVVLALAAALRLDLMGQPQEARPEYERALALASEVAAPPLRARVLLRYGVHLRRAGEAVAARRPFNEAQQIAEAVGAEPLAQRAGDELAAVGGRKRQRREDPDALTFAESRVASLAHEGLGDREIAGRLSLSVNTIETHLQHVYRKLGIKSRRELMRLTSLPLAASAAEPGTSAAGARTSAGPAVARAQSPRQTRLESR
jgi:DNA-binding CsgD family transcriptional regulator